MKLTSRNTRIIAFVLLLVGGFAVYLWLHAGQESTDDAAIAAHIVTISPKVSGYIKKLYVLDNQEVKAGDVLFEIDPADYLIKRDHALATLAAAKAGNQASKQTLDTTLISAPSTLEAAEAQTDAAQANWRKAFNDLKRMQHLSNEARSREQLDNAVAVEKTAKSTLEDAKARLRTAKTAPKVIASAKANSDSTAAMIKQAEAELAQAENDLANTRILAPMDGKVTRKVSEQGDYVVPGQLLGSLVGKEFWVIANFKETQLRNMHNGSKATIIIDAFPKTHFAGHIDSIQSGTGARFSNFPPENATGNFVKVVQRIPVKILFDQQPDASLPVGVGMSLDVTIYDK